MKVLRITLVLMMAIAVMAGAVSAAPTRIAAITDHVDGPFRVAVDAAGKLYVTQKNMVVIYSSEGRYVNSFQVVPPRNEKGELNAALGIAVDAAGKIYVGAFIMDKPNYTKSSIDIYNPDLTFAGRLGSTPTYSGIGEVGKPNDISIGPDGTIYVVDSVNSRVKGYDPVANTSITFNGTFRRPTAIAVSNAVSSASEVYVIDYQPDGAGGEFARIQAFDKSGQFRRSLNFPVGQSPLPVGIAVDSVGLLYVTATRLSYVSVLDPQTGSFTGVEKINYPADPMEIPMQGIAVTKNGLLYALSAGSNQSRGRIDVFALDGYITMAVDPLSLTFVAKQYAGNPDPQTIVISNTSGSNGGTLNWTATADQAWIKLDTAQGSVNASSSAGIPVRLEIGALSAGTYTGAITIDSGFGLKKTVIVNLSVVPANMLTISNGMLDFIGKMGTTPAAKSITVGVDNLSGSLNWSILSDSPSWLTVSPAAGTFSAAAPSSAALVSVNTTSLPVGIYNGVLTVSVTGATPPKGYINVSLSVTSSTKITVNTNRPEAKFTVKGPASFTDTGSGGTKSWENVPAGEYTVTFDAVSGYRKPLPQTKTLAVDGTIIFDGTYVSWKDLAAKKNIVVAKGPEIKNDSQLKVFKGNGDSVSFDLVALATRYGANVAVGDVDGDGVTEIIVGSGDGPNNTAIVRIFRADKDKALLNEFVPFATMNGVRVAAADLNCDETAEVLVSPAGGAENTGTVVAYAYDSGQKRMVPTGIEFEAYKYGYGANMAVADIDGSCKPVIVTAPGFGKQNPALVKIWKIDTAPKVGTWTVSATPLKQITLAGTEGAAVAAGDVDGDGRSEIIVGTGGDHAMVTAILTDGSQVRFRVPDQHNINVAAADLDGDGSAEIITATGPDRAEPEAAGDARNSYSDRLNTRQKDSKEKEAEDGGAEHSRGAVRVFTASGALQYTVVPFEDAKGGISIAVGDLGL